jgi:hypothetical protein
MEENRVGDWLPSPQSDFFHHNVLTSSCSPLFFGRGSFDITRYPSFSDRHSDADFEQIDRHRSCAPGTPQWYYDGMRL